MAEKSNPQELGSGNVKVLSERSERNVVFKLLLNPEFHDKAITAGQPTTLWLHMNKNKEYPPGYRHTWGKAFVSTREDGGDRYPVESIRMRISMPHPGGRCISDETRTNAAEVNTECKYFGAVIGDFTSEWYAEATEPGYGTWSAKDTW